MNNTINQFRYIYDNVDIYQFQSTQLDWIIFVGTIVWGVILMVWLFYFIRFISLSTMSYYLGGALARKKKTLGDLILMKDIQTELEKEIEQAVLKAAFHS